MRSSPVASFSVRVPPKRWARRTPSRDTVSVAPPSDVFTGVVKVPARVAALRSSRSSGSRRTAASDGGVPGATSFAARVILISLFRSFAYSFEISPRTSAGDGPPNSGSA